MANHKLLKIQSLNIRLCLGLIAGIWTLSCVNVQPKAESSTSGTVSTGKQQLHQRKMTPKGSKEVVARMYPILKLSSDKPPTIGYVSTHTDEKGAPKSTINHDPKYAPTGLEPEEKWEKWYTPAGYQPEPLQGMVYDEDDFFSLEFPKANETYYVLGTSRFATTPASLNETFVQEMRSTALDLVKPIQTDSEDPKSPDIRVKIQSITPLTINHNLIVFDKHWKIAGWIKPESGQNPTHEHTFVSVHSATVKNFLTKKQKKLISRMGEFEESNEFKSFFCSRDFIKSALNTPPPAQPCQPVSTSDAASCPLDPQLSKEEVMAAIAKAIQVERDEKAAACKPKATPSVASSNDHDIDHKTCTITADDVEKALEKKRQNPSTSKFDDIFNKGKSEGRKDWIPSSITTDAIFGHCPVWPLSWEAAAKISKACDRSKN